MDQLDELRFLLTPRRDERRAASGSGSAQDGLNNQTIINHPSFNHCFFAGMSCRCMRGEWRTCVGCEDLRENILTVKSTSFRLQSKPRGRDQSIGEAAGKGTLRGRKPGSKETQKLHCWDGRRPAGSAFRSDEPENTTSPAQSRALAALRISDLLPLLTTIGEKTLG